MNKEYKDYWSDCGQVYFHYGKGYGLAENLHSVCLGEEANRILETGELPGDITPDERWALNYILNYRRGNGYGEQPDNGAISVERTSPMRTTGNREKDIRPAKVRQRATIHKINR